MKGGKTPLGYTIIEVLIVLAVSGGMFVIAANFINGKEGKTAFTQGTNEMASQIQNVVEQVTDGKFSDIPLTCTFNGTQTTVNAGTQPQGSNSNCVFLGKVLRFTRGNPGTYSILSLAAGRITVDAAGRSVTPTLVNVHPAVVTSLTSLQTVPQHLDIKSVSVSDASSPLGSPPNTFAYNFGFAEGLGAVNNGSFQSGAQTVAMVYSPINMTSPSTPDTAIDDNVSYAQSAIICMTDGERYAQILIGSSTNNDSQLSIKVQVVPIC